MVFPNTSTDIPEELLQAQEEGRVVFFCGAGISYDAKLPLFKGLLDDTAKKLNHKRPENEERLFSAERYDELYHMYELAIGDRIRVRKATAELLKPVVDREGLAIAKHTSLLKLAHGRDGTFRLVTTNYDCLFDKAARRLGMNVPSFAAPLLPVPKKYKWNGLVYLHGKLDRKPSDENLESLVLSSGDFGQAYLTERWASRFVTELFRDYVVCFVGYRVNDIIVKYMMDALAAERMHGEVYQPVYAFGGCARGHEDACRAEWNVKGIECVPYLLTEDDKHTELTHVLEAWASCHEIGRMSKGAIVKTAMMKAPDPVTEDGRQLISRVVWALKDAAGVKALPSDISETTAQWIEHIPKELVKGQWGASILYWIGRHFNYPQSLQWCVKNAQWLTDANINELYYVVGGASDIKLNEMWHLFLSGFKWSRDVRFVDWCRIRATSHELTPWLRQEFKNQIQPYLSLRVANSVWISDSTDVGRFLDAAVMLNHSMSVFDPKGAKQYLAELLPEITVALVDACEIVLRLNGCDFSNYHIPSLFRDDDHPYSKEEWYYLIVLLKWGLVGCEDAGTRRKTFEVWRELKYPSFYRLVLWCFSRLENQSPEDVVDWLEKNEGALWCDTCMRELLELFDVKMANVSDSAAGKLQGMILGNPYGYMPTDHERATRLEHLERAGICLGKDAADFLARFALEHPNWANRDRSIDGLRVLDDYDEPALGEGLGASGADMKQPPTDAQEAKQFFERLVKDEDVCIPQRLDGWFREKPRESIELLFQVGCTFEFWPSKIWDVAFAMTVFEGCIDKAFEALTVNAVGKMPALLLNDVKLRLAFWLQGAAKHKLHNDASFILCKRFLNEVAADEPVVGTSNSEAPFELVSETLLRNWFDTSPSIGSKIPSPYRDVFTDIASGGSVGLCYARRELLQQIGGLYAIDPDWVRDNLVPLLSWTGNPDGALEAWENAILANRYEPKLLKMVWTDFETLARHYSDMNGFSQSSYAALFLHHAIHVESAASREQCTNILRLLPDKGREQVAHHVYLRLSARGENSDMVWTNEVSRFLARMWPGGVDYVSSAVFKYLADGIVFLDGKFPDGVRVLEKFSVATKKSLGSIHVLARGMNDSLSACDKHPDAALDLLSYIDTDAWVPADDLRECLARIAKANPQLVNSPKYKRLQDMLISRSC